MFAPASNMNRDSPKDTWTEPTASSISAKNSEASGEGTYFDPRLPYLCLIMFFYCVVSPPPPPPPRRPPTPNYLRTPSSASSTTQSDMFRSKAAVLHGARLIGRRSLHRRWALAPAANVVSGGLPSSSSSVLPCRGSEGGMCVSASFSSSAAAAAVVVPEGQPATRGEGGRFPSLVITADAITAE